MEVNDSHIEPVCCSGMPPTVGRTIGGGEMDWRDERRFAIASKYHGGGCDLDGGFLAHNDRAIAGSLVVGWDFGWDEWGGES